MKKIWQKDDLATNILVNNFTVGKDLDFDERLAKYDVKGSMAHCKMLAETGIISQEESEQMVSVLNTILNTIEDGSFEIDKEAEDIHSQIEAILIAELGDTGRVLLRPSGTEELFRVMVEAAEKEQARKVAGKLAAVVAAV